MLNTDEEQTQQAAETADKIAEVDNAGVAEAESSALDNTKEESTSEQLSNEGGSGKEKTTELVHNGEKDGKSKEAEELAQKRKAAAAAQCDDLSNWVKEKCPKCPPIPRMFLYSIPAFIALPLLYRKFFCPPKCLRIGKCSKIYPGCCEPENRCNRPPCCHQR